MSLFISHEGMVLWDRHSQRKSFHLMWLIGLSNVWTNGGEMNKCLQNGVGSIKDLEEKNALNCTPTSDYVVASTFAPAPLLSIVNKVWQCDVDTALGGYSYPCTFWPCWLDSRVYGWSPSRRIPLNWVESAKTSKKEMCHESNNFTGQSRF